MSGVRNEEENYVDAVTSEKIPETESDKKRGENLAGNIKAEDNNIKSPDLVKSSHEVKSAMIIKETSNAFKPNKPAVTKKPVLSPLKPPVSANKPVIGKKPLVKPVVSEKPKVASSLQARMKMFEQN